MSTLKRPETEQLVELTDEQIHLIAKALADPRSVTICCGRLEAAKVQCHAPQSMSCIR